MSLPAAIEHALGEAGIDGRVATMSSLTGGCIHRVDQITLDDGTTLVVKSTTADHLGLFEEEAASLRVLERTGTVLVPAPPSLRPTSGYHRC